MARMVLGVGFLVLVLGARGQETPVRVSSGTLSGLILKREMPRMTSWEEQLFSGSRGGGMVAARLVISEAGKVEDVTLVRGAPGLAEAALRAYRSWVFRPYVLNGKPVRVTATFTMHLQFGGESPSPYSQAIGVYLPPVRSSEGFCESPWTKEAEFHKNVSGEVMAGLVERRVDPLTPPDGARGAVVLNACIGADGRVEKVNVLFDPEPSLRGPAADALLQWRYRPYLLRGVAVPVVTTVKVNIGNRCTAC